MFLTRVSLSILILGAPMSARSNPQTKELTARVTFYSPETCRFGTQTSTGVRAKRGRTCAVDPRAIPYGSVIKIDLLKAYGLGSLKAEDTGSAVKSRKAALAWGQNCLVVDVFVKSEVEINYLVKRVPKFVKIKIQS